MKRLAFSLALGMSSYPVAAQVVVARYQGPLDTNASQLVKRETYDPVDLALQWRSSSELLITHLEGYSYADMAASTCQGTGVFRVPVDGRGTATPVSVGLPTCDAVQSSYGLTIDPESRWIVYAVHVLPNNSRLVRLELGATRADTLSTSCTVYLARPMLSADGRRVAMDGICNRTDDEDGIYIMRPDGSDFRLLSRPGHFGAEDPNWSPDGSHLTFAKLRSEGGYRNAQIAIVDTSGRSTRIIATGYSPVWSPDGQWIAFLEEDPKAHFDETIHLIRPDGSGERVVFVNREHDSYSRGFGPIPEGLPREPLVWSPDGTALAFSRIYHNGTSVWRLDLASGKVSPVTVPGAP